ncbi:MULTISPECIES: LysR substrate-binding domain-containing protein [unclassified Aureimonas]|uniref:LysR substrate-binding domain-containing protein n=1 Tax=unclassified Aureimonas TaxID=2615206 RepID=UPI0006FE33BD|nr:MULTISPECIES: LysR substrate-binding domain-containing protein [unclassified Aureimonas]KQT68952.1 hypothetical protein ASG54_04635 [Aureimonas sp. Leaf460]KQT69180.1 hypothetical protein ASG62_17240 [Aureimonas sp. Leaf427]
MSSLRRLVPSMNALLAFEASVRLKSFAGAARELNVTPAAVSRMVARLEAHVGLRLLLRSATGSSPTDSGALLFAGLTKSFAGIEAALTEIEARRSGQRSVTLSVSTAFTTHWLMPRMGRFQAELPEIDLHFRLLPGPARGPVDDVDLGMRFDAFDMAHEVTLLAPEVVLPVCSPAYRDAHGPEVGGGAMIDLSGEAGLSDLLGDLAGTIRPAQSLAFSDYAIVVQAALLGQGVALGWLNVVAHWLREGALVPAAPRLRVTGRPCQLVRLKARPASPAVEAVRDWIAAEMAAEIAAIDTRHPALGLARSIRARR